MRKVGVEVEGGGGVTVATPNQEASLEMKNLWTPRATIQEEVTRRWQRQQKLIQSNKVAATVLMILVYLEPS